MSEPSMNSWDQPEDEGVLDDADTLASEDMTEDRLDAGIEPPDADPAVQDWGDTEDETRQGETLDQRLAEEEPDLSTSPVATSRGSAASPSREAGQLTSDVAIVDAATELPAAVPDDERSADEAAIRVRGGRP